LRVAERAIIHWDADAAIKRESLEAFLSLVEGMQAATAAL
jgi:hypothetical protein